MEKIKVNLSSLGTQNRSWLIGKVILLLDENKKLCKLIDIDNNFIDNKLLEENNNLLEENEKLKCSIIDYEKLIKSSITIPNWNKVR